MSERWSLSGYDVHALVDAGSAGDLWRARELASGEVVALRRLGRGVDVEHLRSSAARQVDLPYAVRLRDVVDDGQVLVLVLDHAPGGSLEMLLARRGALGPGEVVTIGVPLAEALAAAHARGLVHGELTTSSVLFGDDGMPLLAGIGLLATEARPADDVAALAALCRGLLDPSPGAGNAEAAAGAAPTRVTDPPASTDPPAGTARAPDLDELLRVLDRACDGSGSMDAAALGAALRRSHPASPVRLGRPRQAAAGRPPGAPMHASGASRVPAGARAAAAVLLLVVAGAAGGWWSGRGGDQAPPRVSALPGPAAADGAGAGADGAGGPPATAAAVDPAGAATGRAGAAPATAGPAAAPPATTAPATTAAPAGTAPSADGTAGEWQQVLDALDSMRAAAFAAADERALRGVYAPGASGRDVDLRLLRALSSAGRTAHGVGHTVREARVLGRTADRVRLRVTDVLAPYELRDAAGTVVGRGPGRDARTSVVELHRTPGGWRLMSVTPG